MVTDGAEPVAGGGTFEGGGRHYDVSTDVQSLLGVDAARTIETCLEKTDAAGVVFAYGTSSEAG